MPSPPPSAPWVGLALLLVAGCASPAQHVADADREVYDILVERREAIAAGEAFTIERSPATLRDRLLAGADAPAELSLADALEIGAENSRRYQERREALYLAALDLTLERWRFSVQESGTFGAFLSGDGDGARDAGVLSNLGLARLLGTGLAIVGNASLDLVRDVSTGDGWDALSNLSLNITQPLLRGFGPEIVREPLTQAERDVVYEARAYGRFRATFGFEVATRLFRILEQEDVLRNEELNFEGLTRLRERNEAFAEAGLLNEIQVDQARQDELRARNRVIEARRSLASAQDSFKLFLGLPIETELRLAQGAREVLGEMEALAVPFEEEGVLAVALAQRYDYATARDRTEDAERRVRVAADDLRTGLGLSLQANASSREGQPLEFQDGDIAWTLGVEVDLPWDRLPERNAYRASLIRRDAARRAEEETADQIRTDLRDALRRLEAVREGFEIQTLAVELAERRVESAQLNLEAGRASTRDLLEAQEDLVEARNAASSARTDYLLTGLSLYVDMELVRVDESGLRIDAGPLLQAMQRPRP